MDGDVAAAIPGSEFCADTHGTLTVHQCLLCSGENPRPIGRPKARLYALPLTFNPFIVLLLLFVKRVSEGVLLSIDLFSEKGLCGQKD